MRKIKFRSFLKSNGKMIYDFTQLSNNVNTDDELRVLMQYTGLKDKNGTEIYEGDILTGFVFKERWTGSVEYLAPYFAVLGENSHIILEDLEECMVIGNIYENPHII